jgi:hypothetical protein
MRKKPCAPPDKFGNSAEHPPPARHRNEIRPKFPGRFLSGNTTGADNVIFFTNFSCGRRAQLLNNWLDFAGGMAIFSLLFF